MRSEKYTNNLTLEFSAMFFKIILRLLEQHEEKWEGLNATQSENWDYKEVFLF